MNRKAAALAVLVFVCAAAVCLLVKPWENRTGAAQEPPSEPTVQPAQTANAEREEFLRAVRAADRIRFLPPAYSSQAYPDAVTDPDLLAEVKAALERVGETDGAPASEPAELLMTERFCFDEAAQPPFYCVSDGYLCASGVTQTPIVIGKAPEGLMGAVESAARRQRDRDASASLRVWVDHYGEEGIWDLERQALALPVLPETIFSWTPGELCIEDASGGGKRSFRIPGMPVWNAFFEDLTGDRVPELCATVSFGSGLVDDHVVVFDAVEWKQYALWDRGAYDYVLSAADGGLVVERSGRSGREPAMMGMLRLDGGRLEFVPFTQPGEDGGIRVMGLDVRREDEELVPSHYLHSYVVQTADGPLTVAESFGFVLDDHVLDLDGDGVTELVCNCVFGGDGVSRVYVFRRNGDVIERGGVDYEKLALTAWDDRGSQSTAEWYDPTSGKVLVKYASLAGSAVDRALTKEAGRDAFAWEEFAVLPGPAGG